MDMTLTVHVALRSPRPAQVLVRWSGAQTAGTLRRALSDHLEVPVPALGSRGATIPTEALVGVPPLVHGASVTVLLTAGAALVGGVERPAPDAVHARVTPVTSAVELVVVGGPDSGRSATIGPSGLEVGRSPEVGLRIEDDSLSRVHARFTATPAGITVEDRASTNGVQLAGRRVSGPTLVDTASTIVLGGSVLALRRRPGAGLPVRPCGDGRLAIRPTQAPEPAASAPTVEAPVPPAARRVARVPWVAALLPLPVAVVLAVVFGPQMLAFALLGPAVLLGTALGDRWGSGREHRRAMAEHRLATKQAVSLLHQRLRHECDRRRSESPDPQRVLVVAEHRQPGLWQQAVPRPVRVGLGDLPAQTTWVEGSDVTRPSAPLVPVTVDLTTARRLGVVGDRALTDRLLGSLLGQVVVDLPPTRLRTTVTSDDASWQWARLLPHAAAPPVTDVHDSTAGSPEVTHLLVVPDAGDLDSQGWAQCLRSGALVIVAAPTHEELPGGCTTVLTQRPGAWSLASTECEVYVAPDLVGGWWTDRVARALAPLCLEAGPGAAPPLPSAVGLPQLVGLTEVTEPSVTALWSSAAPSPPVAPVGIGPDGPWSIDLRRDGPHLLVGGTTGSGKSEFLRTLVTSLCLACPPEDLTFVLVDFKGGSAFGDCTALPHVVGLVTDLDDHLVDRALRSLGAELRRRERLFADLGARDLEDFQRRRHRSDAQVPRLVVVIDELRALVDELPGFVSGLVRIAALGRSLGVHLVLATQRPAGAITSEIQANVNLRIAFRVRDRADSIDVLDDSGAASIPGDVPGRGMARAGGGPVVTFQAATLSHDVAAGDPFLRVSAPEPDGSVRCTEHADGPGSSTTAPRHRTSTVVAAIAAAHAARGVPEPRAPWLAPLPGIVPFGLPRGADTVGDGCPPTTADETVGGRAPILGEWPGVALVDQPDQQSITVLGPPRGHTWLLSGPPGSGRTTAARAVALARACTAGSGDLHVHVIEVAGALADLEGLDHLGSRLRADDHRAIRHLIELLRAEVDSRLHTTRGIPARPDPPDVVLLVDGWEQLVEAQPEADHGRTADDLVRLLRDGRSGGLTGVVTGGRSLLQPRWAAVGAELFLLGETDPLDAALAGVQPRDVLLAPPPGRAIRVADRQHIQFVSATALDAGRVPAGTTDPDEGRRPTRVRPLPHHVRRCDVPDLPAGQVGRDDPRLLLGVGGHAATAIWLQPARDGRRVAIVGPAGSGRTTALQTLARSTLDAGRTVAVLTPRPEQWDAVPGCLVCSATAPEPVVALRRECPGLVLLVDDADRLDGTPAEPVVREVAALVDRDDGLLAVATTARAMATRFRGVDVEVCRDQTGLLLCPETGDGECLGVRGLHGIERTPGRGVLVARGTATEVQVIAPETPGAAVRPGRESLGD